MKKIDRVAKHARTHRTVMDKKISEQEQMFIKKRLTTLLPDKNIRKLVINALHKNRTRLVLHLRKSRGGSWKESDNTLTFAAKDLKNDAVLYHELGHFLAAPGIANNSIDRDKIISIMTKHFPLPKRQDVDDWLKVFKYDSYIDKKIKKKVQLNRFKGLNLLIEFGYVPEKTKEEKSSYSYCLSCWNEFLADCFSYLHCHSKPNKVTEYLPKKLLLEISDLIFSTAKASGYIFTHKSMKIPRWW